MGTKTIERPVLVDAVVQQLPCFGMVVIAGTQVAPVSNPLLHIGLLFPRTVEEVLINLRTHIEGLQSGADAGHVRSRLLQGGGEFLLQFVDIAHQHGVATEVAEVAPDEGLSVETVGGAPNLRLFAEVVEQHQLVLGHGGEVGA